MHSSTYLVRGKAVTIVTVCYNSAAVIGDMLTSVPPEAGVVVVDNASTDRSVARCREAGAVVIEQTRNIGFGAACNAGAAATDSPFLLFLNPDARLHPNALDHLFEGARQYVDAAGFNPLFRKEDGTAFVRGPSRFLTVGRRRPVAMPSGDCALDVLSGAALFCRAAAFHAVGGFDERIFLYFEDDDLSLRFQAAGYRLMHIHAAVVEHAAGHSTPPSPALTHFKNVHWMRSYRYVSRKHGRRFRAGRLILRNGANWIAAAVRGDGQGRAQAAGRLSGLLWHYHLAP